MYCTRLIVDKHGKIVYDGKLQICNKYKQKENVILEDITANSLCLVRREFLNLIEKAFFLQIDSLITETQTEDSRKAMNLSKEIFLRLKSSRNSFHGTTTEEMREEIQKAMFEGIVQEIRKEEHLEAKAALKQNLILPGGVFLRTLEIVFNFNK